MTPAEMEQVCLHAIRRGDANVSVTLPGQFKFPAGFPRGELLCRTRGGDYNHSIDPRRLLGWLLTTDTLPPRTTP